MPDGTANLEVTVEQPRFSPHVVNGKASVSVVGLGYVGAVTVGCLSSLGHRIVGVDVDPRKIARVGEGRSPIHESGLDPLLTEGVEGGIITTTDDLQGAVVDTDVTFVSVGTPTAPDGSCDTRYIEQVADIIGVALRGKNAFHVVVLRCSVPPGTTMGVMAPRIAAASGKTLGEGFGLAFNPEFLREGVAVSDFHNPPKTVVGASDERSAAIVARIFEPIDAAPIKTAIETAEMVKYVDNVWHATKVCFANEVGRLAKAVEVDGTEVMEIFCKDTKLNLSSYYLKPGFAYGGSCLPKEVRAVTHLAEKRNVDLPLIASLGKSNAVQIDRTVDMVLAQRPERVCVLGLAFKPGTNDLRESPILEVLQRLDRLGIAVQGHDCYVTPETVEESAAHAAATTPRLKPLCDRLPDMLCARAEDAMAEADTVIVTHNLPEYRWLLEGSDLPIVDVTRLFDRDEAPAKYQGIGW